MINKFNNKNIFLVLFWVCTILTISHSQEVYRWALEFNARDVDTLGIGDYIRLEMEDHEPYADCGVDNLCDEDEPGYDEESNPDPEGDNYNIDFNPTGTENNNKWDGDIYHDFNENCQWDEGEYFVDRNENGIYDIGENYDDLNEDCKFEEGGDDGWRQGEDEFDIPPPLGDHTNIKFKHLEWLGEEDVNGFECCESVSFSVDKRAWHTPDEIIRWDIYGNTSGVEGSILLSWSVDSLEWEGWEYNIYLHTEGSVYNMRDIESLIVDNETLSSSEPNISIVIGECAESGTVTFYYDNDEDGLGSCGSIPESEICPKEFCEGKETGECSIVLDEEDDPVCPENFIYNPGLHSCMYPENISEENCVALGGNEWTAKWVLNEVDVNDDLFCESNNIDDCNICDGGNENKDCTGVCFGTAFVDDCGVCAGGTTGLEPNLEISDEYIVGPDADCNGECFGEAVVDDCSVCVGGTTGLVGNDVDGCLVCPANGVFDCDYYFDTFICVDEDYSYNMGPACDGVCFVDEEYSGAFFDDCDICSEGGTGHLPNSDEDCLEQIFTPGIIDLTALSTESTVELNWTYQADIPAAAGFNIYFLDEGINEWILIGLTENWSYSVEEINAGTFAVSILDSYGHESDWSEPVTATAFEVYTYDLHDGNNLISFRGLPENDAIGHIFQDIEEYVTGVIGEGVAASYLGDGVWVGSLLNIRPSSGYWVIMNLPDPEGIITYTLNQAYPTDQTLIYSLHDGANLISYIGVDSTSVPAAIPDDAEIYFEGVIGEGVAASNIGGGTWVGSLQHWRTQRGYWVIIDIVPDDAIVEMQWEIPPPLQSTPGKNTQ